MGKKRMAMLGSAEEEQLRSKTTVKREQKKLREGKTAKVPGLGGGQRVVDTAAESLRELEVVEAKGQKVVAEGKPKAKKVKVRSHAYQAAKIKVNPEQKYSLPDAIRLLRGISYSKTNNTVEVHLTLKVKGISKEIELPHSTGRARRVAIADDKFFASLEAGTANLDIDCLLAAADQMPRLVKFAKILGPRGLMPNPKTGTLVADPAAAAAKMASQNTLALKTEKDNPLIHTVVGKLSMSDAQLSENIAALLKSLPQISKAVLKSTMSPAIRLAAYTIN